MPTRPIGSGDPVWLNNWTIDMDVLVLPPRYTDDSVRLAKAAGQAGWVVERLASWHIPPLLHEEQCCLFAEPLFVMHAAAALGLAMIEPPYGWLPDLPDDVRRRRVWLTTGADARQLGDRWFLKSAGEKFFAPGVYAGRELPIGVPDQLPVIAAEVVTFTAEFRVFVLDRQAVASSPYWIGGRLATDEHDRWTAAEPLAEAAAAFVHRLLDDPRVSVPPAVVIDVGRIAGRGWAVVEANPAWGSGLYGCDPTAVLPVVRRASVGVDRLTEADRAWVIDHGAEDFR